MSSESNSKWSKSPEDTGDQNLILVDSWICLFLIQEINIFFFYQKTESKWMREKSESKWMKSIFIHHSMLLSALWHLKSVMNNIFKLSQKHFAPFLLFVHNFVTQIGKVSTSVSRWSLGCGSCYKPFSILEVLFVLIYIFFPRYFHNESRKRQRRICGEWEGKSMDTTFPRSLGFLHHVTSVPYFILAEYILLCNCGSSLLSLNIQSH